jgi:ubiquinone/menaquinone biosynthesis C-methylase UbiE
MATMDKIKSLFMDSQIDTSSVYQDDVAKANQRFYDQIAEIYDEVDRRRGDHIDHNWVDEVFNNILEILASSKEEVSELSFLDAASGSGFLAQRARKFFPRMTLLDISRNMLKRIDLPETLKVCSDTCFIPAKESSFDVIGGFATLHHLKSPKKFFQESYRVLRPGGIIYTDHDIESQFVKNFRPMLWLYRKFFDHGKDYLKQCPESSELDYLLSEYHGEEGLSGPKLAEQLSEVGFQVREIVYHWEGMGPAASFLEKLGFSGILKRRGLAPVIRLIAVKLTK